MYEIIRKEIIERIETKDSKIIFNGIVLRKSKLININSKKLLLLLYLICFLVFLSTIFIIASLVLFLDLNKVVIPALSITFLGIIRYFKNIILMKMYRRFYKDDSLTFFAITTSNTIHIIDFEVNKHKVSIIDESNYSLFNDVTILYDKNYIYLFNENGDIIESFLDNSFVPYYSCTYWKSYIETTMKKTITKAKPNYKTFKSPLYNLDIIKNEFKK